MRSEYALMNLNRQRTQINDITFEEAQEICEKLLF